MRFVRIFDPATEQHNMLNAIPMVDRALELAGFYCDCICAGKGVDWAKVNNAILGRYKMSTLQRIKKEAWRQHEELRSYCAAQAPMTREHERR